MMMRICNVSRLISVFGLMLSATHIASASVLHAQSCVQWKTTVSGDSVYYCASSGSLKSRAVLLKQQWGVWQYRDYHFPDAMYYLICPTRISLKYETQSGHVLLACGSTDEKDQCSAIRSRDMGLQEKGYYYYCNAGAYIDTGFTNIAPTSFNRSIHYGVFFEKSQQHSSFYVVCADSEESPHIVRNYMIACRKT